MFRWWADRGSLLYVSCVKRFVGGLIVAYFYMLAVWNVSLVGWSWLTFICLLCETFRWWADRGLLLYACCVKRFVGGLIVAHFYMFAVWNISLVGWSWPTFICLLCETFRWWSDRGSLLYVCCVKRFVGRLIVANFYMFAVWNVSLVGWSWLTFICLLCETFRWWADRGSLLYVCCVRRFVGGLIVAHFYMFAVWSGSLVGWSWLTFICLLCETFRW